MYDGDSYVLRKKTETRDELVSASEDRRRIKLVSDITGDSRSNRKFNFKAACDLFNPVWL